MKALRGEISQLVSHLTWDRVTTHEARHQDWSLDRLAALYEHIRVKARETFTSIPEERQEWFATEDFPDEFARWTA